MILINVWGFKSVASLLNRQGLHVEADKIDLSSALQAAIQMQVRPESMKPVAFYTTEKGPHGGNLVALSRPQTAIQLTEYPTFNDLLASQEHEFHVVCTMLQRPFELIDVDAE